MSRPYYAIDDTATLRSFYPIRDARLVLAKNRIESKIREAELKANLDERMDFLEKKAQPVLSFEKARDLLRFQSLCKIAKAVLENQGELFGSFIHYLVWCTKQSLQPFSNNTMKVFLESGKYIPEDLDIIVASKEFDIKPIIEKISADIRVNIEHCSEEGLYKCFQQAYVKIDNIIFGNIYVKVDLVHLQASKQTSIYFDVNSLKFCEQRGFQKINPMSSYNFLTLMNEHDEITKIMDCIYTKLAKFESEFEAGPHRSSDRIRMLKRFQKLLERGFTIIGWGEKYPVTEINCIDGNVACCICKEEMSIGTSCQLLKCCTRASKNVLCKECFWKSMFSNIYKRTFTKCPLCNHEESVF
jgi:hypothetical protein